MTTLYIDTSAFLRAFVAGSPEQADAQTLLATPTVTLISSELLWLEVDRFITRVNNENPAVGPISATIHPWLSRIASLTIDRGVVAAARRIKETIKSLDAIHVASAESLGDSLDSVVTYDKTMTTVLRAHGVPVHTAAQVNPLFLSSF